MTAEVVSRLEIKQFSLGRTSFLIEKVANVSEIQQVSLFTEKLFDRRGMPDDLKSNDPISEVHSFLTEGAARQSEIKRAHRCCPQFFDSGDC